jgi:ATP-dependent protease ClpP protease subunit
MKKLPFTLSIQANANSDEPAEMSIRGIIGSSFDPETWTMKTTEDEVLSELAQIPKGKKINVRINSPGGDFGLALGCYNALATRHADVTTYNAGFACSAASCLMLAGANRVSPPSCNWMIHCASSGTYGNSADHQKSLDMLKSIDKTMAAMYCKASGVGTPEEWLAKMEKETWMTGDEACDMKLATSSEGETDSPEIEMTAETKKVIATFKHIPTNLQPRFNVAATAVNPPPTNNNQPKIKSMKKIIAALVASGITCADDANEETVVAHVSSIISQRDGFKNQIDAATAARKTRVEAAVNQAVTDKIVSEVRKASMIATGCASSEGETVILDQITDLREAKATNRRGANPVPRGTQTGEEESIEALLEEQRAAIAANNSDDLAAVNQRLAKARKREPLFTKPEYTRARQN